MKSLQFLVYVVPVYVAVTPSVLSQQHPDSPWVIINSPPGNTRTGHEIWAIYPWITGQKHEDSNTPPLLLYSMLDIAWERVFSLWANNPKFHDPSFRDKSGGPMRVHHVKRSLDSDDKTFANHIIDHFTYYFQGNGTGQVDSLQHVRGWRVFTSLEIFPVHEGACQHGQLKNIISFQT